MSYRYRRNRIYHPGEEKRPDPKQQAFAWGAEVLVTAIFAFLIALFLFAMVTGFASGR